MNSFKHLQLVLGSALDLNCGLRAGWGLKSADDDDAILADEKVKVKGMPRPEMNVTSCRANIIKLMLAETWSLVTRTRSSR